MRCHNQGDEGDDKTTTQVTLREDLVQRDVSGVYVNGLLFTFKKRHLFKWSSHPRGLK